MSTVTVLTPVYNRVNKMQSLFLSLKEQTAKDFEWMIVDDGSTDRLPEAVSEWISEAGFLIYYIRKNNGGKHTALNCGIDCIQSTLTFIVDSDDSLTADAIETVLKYHRRYSGYTDICGFSFLRMFPDGKINGKFFKQDEYIASYIDARINSNDLKSDKAEAFYTKCLKEYPFPVFSGETFLGEDTVWIQMAQRYKMVHINKAIYISAYLKDGLTKNRRIHNVNSPLGCICRAEVFLKAPVKARYQLKAAMQYVVYGRFAGEKAGSLLKKAPKRLLVVIAYPIGSLLYLIWRNKYIDEI